jgi:hypothetical protein
LEFRLGFPNGSLLGLCYSENNGKTKFRLIIGIGRIHQQSLSYLSQVHGEPLHSAKGNARMLSHLFPPFHQREIFDAKLHQGSSEDAEQEIFDYGSRVPTYTGRREREQHERQ